MVAAAADLYFLNEQMIEWQENQAAPLDGLGISSGKFKEAAGSSGKTGSLLSEKA